MTPKRETETIMKEDLTEVARKAESLFLLLTGIDDDYFGRTDYRDTIAIHADTLRKHINICIGFASELTKELHDNGIYCYDDP